MPSATLSAARGALCRPFWLQRPDCALSDPNLAAVGSSIRVGPRLDPLFLDHDCQNLGKGVESSA